MTLVRPKNGIVRRLMEAVERERTRPAPPWLQTVAGVLQSLGMAPQSLNPADVLEQAAYWLTPAITYPTARWGRAKLHTPYGDPQQASMRTPLHEAIGGRSARPMLEGVGPPVLVVPSPARKRIPRAGGWYTGSGDVPIDPADYLESAFHEATHAVQHGDIPFLLRGHAAYMGIGRRIPATGELKRPVDWAQRLLLDEFGATLGGFGRNQKGLASYLYDPRLRRAASNAVGLAPGSSTPERLAKLMLEEPGRAVEALLAQSIMPEAAKARYRALPWIKKVLEREAP